MVDLIRRRVVEEAAEDTGHRSDIVGDRHGVVI